MSLQNSWPRIMSSSNKRALPVDTEDSKQGLNHLKVRTLTVINKLTSKLIASLHQWVQKAYPRTPTTKALLLRPCALSMMEASAEHRSCPEHWQKSSEQSSDCYQTRPSAAGRSRVDLFCWHHLNWCKTSPKSVIGKKKTTNPCFLELYACCLLILLACCRVYSHDRLHGFDHALTFRERSFPVEVQRWHRKYCMIRFDNNISI